MTNQPEDSNELTVTDSAVAGTLRWLLACRHPGCGLWPPARRCPTSTRAPPRQGHAHRRDRQGHAGAASRRRPCWRKRWANASPDLKALAALEEAGHRRAPDRRQQGHPAVRRPGHHARNDGGRRAPPPARSTWKPISSTRTSSATQFADLLIEKQRQGVTVNIMSTRRRPRDAGRVLRPHARGRHPPAGLQSGQPGQGRGQVGTEQPQPPQADGGRRPHRLHGRHQHQQHLRQQLAVPLASRSRDRSTARRSAGATPTSRSKARPWRRCSSPSSTCGCSRKAASCRRPTTSRRCTPAGDKMMRVLASDPDKAIRTSTSRWCVAISEAKKSIHITSRLFRAGPADRRRPDRRRRSAASTCAWCCRACPTTA